MIITPQDKIIIALVRVVLRLGRQQSLVMSAEEETLFEKYLEKIDK